MPIEDSGQHITGEPNQENPITVKLEEDIKVGERWLIGIGIASILINILIAWIYWGQLGEMRKATQATQDAVKVARDTLTASQQSSSQARIDSRADSVASDKRANDALQASIDQFRQEQRAWVGLTGFRVELSPALAGQDRAVAGFFNSGHTPALHVGGIVGFGFKDRKRLMSYEDAQWMATQISITREGIDKAGRKDWWFRGEGVNSYRPWGKLVMGVVILQPISIGAIGPGVTATYAHPTDWHAGANIQYDAFFFGELIYADERSGRHTTRFCVYRPDNVGDKFDYCPVFNDMN